MAEAAHGGDRVAAALAAHGVRFVFALCGGHISPILVGAKKIGLRVVDTRHEATAVYAADAVARLTGTPGVAAVTAGPGLTNTVTAVKNAQQAQSPVIVVGGGAPTVLQGRGALQDVDQMALMRPHVKKAVSVRRVRDVEAAVDDAFETAQSGVPGPVFLEFPIDVLYPEALVRAWYLARPGTSLRARLLHRYLARHLDRMFAPGGGPARPRVVEPPRPSPRLVAKAVARFASAERPVLLVGSQAVLDAPNAPKVAAAVETLGVPVYLSGMARGLLGARHPLQRFHKRREALAEADLMVLAGVPFDFRLDYGRSVRADTIAANRSRRDLRLNRTPTIGVLGDPGLFLRGLAAETVRRDRPGWLAKTAAADAAREAEIDAQAASQGNGIHPIALCRALDKELGPASILVGDGGDFVATAAYTVRPRGPLGWLDPGVFGTLGVGAGFALGAKLVRPEADVWILYGDGALAYSLAEQDTFARHGIPVVSIVGNDASWAQIARDQVGLLGDDVGTRLASTDYDVAARGLGARGTRVETASAFSAAVREAKRSAKAGRPFLVNAILAASGFRKGSISM